MLASPEGALREAARLLGALALPILLAVLAAGVLVGLLGGVTKLRDRSISVVPRIVAVAIALALLGGWAAARVEAYTRQMFHAVEAVSHGR